MSNLRHHSKTTSGFTLPELIVGMVMTMILTLAMVGLVTTLLGQHAIGDVREKQTGSLYAALNRISDDIRQSYTVLVQNSETDTNAPTSPGKWMTGTSQLVLGKTPRDSSGNGLYELPEYFSGKPDSIIYYTKNGTLYRRVVPANYAGNVALPLINCSSNPLGGCPEDIAILADITQLQFTYLDANNIPGATPPQTKSINVSITTSRQQSGQTVTTTDSVRASIQTLTALVPPPSNGGGNPPPSAQNTPGLMIGPGGLQSNFSDIVGGNTYIKGRLTLLNQAKVNIPGYRLDVANTGCGSRATFPVACTGQQPIDATAFATKAVASPICAPGQTVMTHLTGYQAGCTLPNISLPTFNKSAFTASMTSTVNSNVSCNTGNAHTLAANTRVNGNFTANFCQDLTLAGNAYITGDLTLTYTSNVKVAEGLTTSPIIVVNGRVEVSSVTDIVANSAGVTPIIISFYSSNSTCRTSDSCVTIPNTDLYDTINSSNHAITVKNNADVNGSLYAYFGTVRIDFGFITGAIAGQKLFIDNNSSVRLVEGVWPG